MITINTGVFTYDGFMFENGDVTFYGCIFTQDINDDIKMGMKADIVNINFAKSIILIYLNNKRYRYSFSIIIEEDKED